MCKNLPIGLQDVDDPDEQQEALSLAADSWNSPHASQRTEI